LTLQTGAGIIPVFAVTYACSIPAAEAADCCTHAASNSRAAIYGIAVAIIAVPPTPTHPVDAVMPAVAAILAASAVRAAASVS